MRPDRWGDDAVLLRFPSQTVRPLVLLMVLGTAADLAAASATVYRTPSASGRPVFTNAPIDSRSVAVWRPPAVAAAAGPTLSSIARSVLPPPSHAVALTPSTRRGGRTPRSSRLEPDPVLVSLITQAAQRHRLDPALVKAVIHVESRFNPNAVSPVGARGLMQVMPATGRRFGEDRLFDPARNIAVGVKYLDHLLDLFDGNVELALAGYNAGEGAVIKHGRRIPPYRETQNYVPKVIEMWHLYRRESRAPEP